MTLAAAESAIHTARKAVLDHLPRFVTVAIVGEHLLGCVAPGDWYILIGPDVTDEDLSWVTAAFTAAGVEFTATFETFGRTLVTHFTKWTGEA